MKKGLEKRGEDIRESVWTEIKQSNFSLKYEKQSSPRAQMQIIPVINAESFMLEFFYRFQGAWENFPLF